MGKYSKRAICAMLCGVIFCNLSFAATPAPQSEAAQAAALSGISAKATILVDENGKVLFEQNADSALAPASVTKVMTMLLIMEAIESGALQLEDTVTVSHAAMSMGGSQIFLKEGEQMSVDDMLKSIAVSSANDCAVAMAEHIAGTEEAFVARMNERAIELKMQNTNFINCNGLPAVGHVTSARDIAIMSVELMRHTKAMEYSQIWMDTVREGAFGLANTNKMLKSYNGMTGLKTGYTADAGYCLSGTATRDEMQLVAVVLGAVDVKARTADIAAMLNYGFATYAKVKITPDAPIMPVPVLLGKKTEVLCALAPAQSLILEKAKIGAIEKQISMPEEIRAPIIMGQKIGTLIVSAAGAEIARVDIVAQEDVEKMKMIDLFVELLRPCALREKP